MASYNVDRDFDTMRQEAIERVRSMQRRSRAVVASRNNNTNNNQADVQETTEANDNAPPTPKVQNLNPGPQSSNTNQNTNKKINQNSSQANPLASILGNLFSNNGGQTKKGPLSELLEGFNISEENALIGIMIYILAKNGADVKLLLGLGYLLL